MANNLHLTNIADVLGGSWSFDPYMQVLINNNTGKKYRMPTTSSLSALTSGTWGVTNAQSVQDMGLSTIFAQLRKETEEYAAMRTFLMAVDPDLLKKFDAAHAAAKRIGAGNGPNTQASP